MTMPIQKPLLTALTLLIALSAAACGDITGRGPAPLDNTVNVKLRQSHERVGYVYCMRGWLGIFSEGMDALANKIDTRLGIPAVSVADEEWRKLETFIVDQHDKGLINDGPLVLLGHSYGADDQIRVAQYLQAHNISVDLLVLIDPVTPPAVPANVKRVYCLYYSHPLTDWYPAWRGIPATVADPEKTLLQNIDLRTTDVGFDTTGIQHPTIDKVEGVHNLCMKQIELTCPSRSEWTQSHPPGTHVTQSPPTQSPSHPISVRPAN
jgi:hypothetical protein